MIKLKDMMYKDIIYQNLIKEGVFDPSIFKAIFVAGGPGSGKSYIAGEVTSGMGFKFIASDQAFELFLKKANMSAKLNRMTPDEFDIATSLRAKAKETAAKIKASHEAGRLGLIFDGTGHDFGKIKHNYNGIKKLGYDAYMIFINTSLDVALERNENRPRSLPDDVVKQKWEAVQTNIGKFNSLFGSNFVVVDNNEYNQDFSGLWKQIRKFSTAPIKNPIAKNWIDNQMALRKRL